MRFLDIFFLAVALLCFGFQASCSHFDRLYRWWMWIRHRRGCGTKEYRVLRRRQLSRQRKVVWGTDMQVVTTEITCTCPQCGRVHYFTSQEISPLFDNPES